MGGCTCSEAAGPAVGDHSLYAQNDNEEEEPSAEHDATMLCPALAAGIAAMASLAELAARCNAWLVSAWQQPGRGDVAVLSPLKQLESVELLMPMGCKLLGSDWLAESC